MHQCNGFVDQSNNKMVLLCIVIQALILSLTWPLMPTVWSDAYVYLLVVYTYSPLMSTICCRWIVQSHGGTNAFTFGLLLWRNLGSFHFLFGILWSERWWEGSIGIEIVGLRFLQSGFLFFPSGNVTQNRLLLAVILPFRNQGRIKESVPKYEKMGGGAWLMRYTTARGSWLLGNPRIWSALICEAYLGFWCRKIKKDGSSWSTNLSGNQMLGKIKDVGWVDVQCYLTLPKQRL
jgi:hypothetical protein